MSKQPFFARFLEGQGNVKTGLRAGHGHRTTLKYPSDLDENVTMKWPSDDDEGETS